MNIEQLKGFEDPKTCQKLIQVIQKNLKHELRFMEVCGTHTVAIFQSGLRTLFPKKITHLSGPGCPVCVTHSGEIAAFLNLALTPKIRIATFGDMLKVPGPGGETLKTAKAKGAKVNICYSPFDALNLAQKHPKEEIVFLGVGFETTAPAVAATILQARELGIKNFSVFSCHKLVPPALGHLLQGGEVKVQAFLLPGHVSAIIGVLPYTFLAAEYQIPTVIAGFEPVDILLALAELSNQIRQGKPRVRNLYTRVVKKEGNRKAQQIMNQVFIRTNSKWRGLGSIPASGLELNPELAAFDAKKRFDVLPQDVPEPPGCKCGQVLQGKIAPPQCPLFAKACTPASPVGPCMVSTEGSCAAHFKYALT